MSAQIGAQKPKDDVTQVVAEIRSLFTRAGGSLAEPGAVAWQFDRKGVVVCPVRSTRTS